MGFWYTAKRSQIAPMPPEKSGILKQEKVAMISIGLHCSAVAATTDRGFKSRQPDSCDCHYFDAQAVKKASINSGSSSL